MTYSLIPCGLMEIVAVLEAVVHGCQEPWASIGSCSWISWISTTVGALCSLRNNLEYSRNLHGFTSIGKDDVESSLSRVDL